MDNELILLPHSCISEQGYFNGFKWKYQIEFNYTEISSCGFPLGLYNSHSKDWYRFHFDATLFDTEWLKLDSC